MEWDRLQYAKDLETLAQKVQTYDSDKIFQNLESTLYVVAGKVKHHSGNLICVCAENIEIVLKKAMSGSIPPKLNTLTITFDSCVEFDISVDISVNDRIQDSFDFQIELKGIDEDGEHFNSWHLDKDIRKPGANPPKVSHPLYHFQSGGNRLEGRAISGAVFLGAPRLPHPPMDVILGLHFILKNFCSMKDYVFLNKLFNDFDYEEIIFRAKERMFTPYFRAYESGNSHQDFTFENVFPLAVS
ncbi:hypothetical protein [Thiomicrorhabdus indica]|uniref:hypothetical protein n=1 Tax=Thiomicrorhabdus indica TaxID=2267253 RepID=UPI00102DD130|nr:hypothetical protein [Thiomicrorhabdus indica]